MRNKIYTLQNWKKDRGGKTQFQSTFFLFFLRTNAISLIRFFHEERDNRDSSSMILVIELIGTNRTNSNPLFQNTCSNKKKRRKEEKKQGCGERQFSIVCTANTIVNFARQRRTRFPGDRLKTGREKCNTDKVLAIYTHLREAESRISQAWLALLSRRATVGSRVTSLQHPRRRRRFPIPLLGGAKPDFLLRVTSRPAPLDRGKRKMDRFNSSIGGKNLEERRLGYGLRPARGSGRKCRVIRIGETRGRLR